MLRHLVDFFFCFVTPFFSPFCFQFNKKKKHLERAVLFDFLLDLLFKLKISQSPIKAINEINKWLNESKTKFVASFALLLFDFPCQYSSRTTLLQCICRRLRFVNPIRNQRGSTKKNIYFAVGCRRSRQNTKQPISQN